MPAWHACLRRVGLALAIAAIGLLAGCASKVVIDSEVRSVSRLPASTVKPAYRFERQIALADAQQKEIEGWADGALFRAGLQRDDAQPRYSVQLGARVQPVVTYVGGVRSGVWVAPPYRGLPSYGLRPFGSMRPMETAWYQYEASVTLREIATSQVVYETRATSEQPWNNPGSIFPALFDMALQGFPVPPEGVRRLRVETDLK
ncbi:MAG: hypothetical protein EBU07_07035 [Betaproteobacteria bacterium]|nr:hypothetical protein [Betaproteobacteria bacterium]NBS45484.1 hypothetical protein [Betaproteobacteria bacterium]